jgi:hypothetical protein
VGPIERDLNMAQAIERPNSAAFLMCNLEGSKAAGEYPDGCFGSKNFPIGKGVRPRLRWVAGSLRDAMVRAALAKVRPLVQRALLLFSVPTRRDSSALRG